MMVIFIRDLTFCGSLPIAKTEYSSHKRNLDFKGSSNYVDLYNSLHKAIVSVQWRDSLSF